MALADRDNKHASTRRSALMPSTLRHTYVLLAPSSLDGQDAAWDTPAVGKATVAGGTLDRAGGRAVSGDDPMASSPELLLKGLWAAMQRIDPAPAIVFAGRAGVTKTRDALQARGLSRVHLLKDAVDDGSITHVPPADAQPSDAGPADLQAASWERTDVFVGSERWGRGLDLDVDYVFLLTPPANSASYAHLAGRTARRGKHGTAITILSHRHAPRMVAFAEALGITLAPLG